MSTTVPILAKRAADNLRHGWASLVTIALQSEPGIVEQAAKHISERAKVGFDSTKRKLLAIQYAHFELGLTADAIIIDGQHDTLSRYQVDKRTAQYAEKVWLRYAVVGSVRELFNQQLLRVSRVCDLPNAAEFFSWLVAQLQQLSDDDLIHSIGEGNGTAKKER